MKGKDENEVFEEIDTRRKRDMKKQEFEEPEFQTGCLYIVKALDHFTRHNDTVEELFIEFIGFFIEETKNGHYYKFCSYYYEEVTTEKDFYSPEIRFILKSAITEFLDLNFQVIEGKFRECLMDSNLKT